MPVCKQRNLLFIHIPKNGGQSIEQALFGDDFTAAIGKRSRLNRLATFAKRVTSTSDALTYLHGTLDYTLCAQHLTYSEIRLLGLVSEQFLKQAFSFSVVRNPYTRIVSSVYHFADEIFPRIGVAQPRCELELERAISVWLDLEPIDHNMLAHRRPQSEFVLDLDGNVAVDEIVHFENLEEGYGRLCDRLNWERNTLPRVGKRKSSAGWIPTLSPPARRMIQKYFERDFELFNYLT